jgi:hypothetical protein
MLDASCSLLLLATIPGKGSTSLVHTSASSASNLALSARAGASTGMRLFVVRRDWDLLIACDDDGWCVAEDDADDADDEEGGEEGAWLSFAAEVFLRMTW